MEHTVLGLTSCEENFVLKSTMYPFVPAYLPTSDAKTTSYFRLVQNDILITALGSELRVALWPAEIAQPAVFSSSIDQSES